MRYEGRATLHLAAAGGKASTVRALIAAGATVEAQDKNGLTPLHVAAKLNGADTVHALLDAGADGRTQTKKDYTPYDLARSNNDKLRGTTAWRRLRDARSQ